MRRVLLLVACTFAVQAFAGVDRSVVEDGTTGAVTSSSNPTQVFGQTGATLVAHTCAANSCTRAEPSASGEGLVLQGVAAYFVSACLSSGTFAGGGAVELYAWDSNTPGWRYLIGLDFDLADAAGRSCVSWGVRRNTLRPSEWRRVAR